MAYRDQYDDEYENRGRPGRDYPEDEGFFDRVRGWFRERVNDRPSEQNYDRDRNRDYSRYQNRSYDRGGRVRVYDQNYGGDYNRRSDYNRGSQRRSYRSGYNQDANYNRDYDSGSGLAYGDRASGDRENNSEWDRTRQWRRDYDRGPENRRGDYQDRYSPRYGSGWGTDQDYQYGLGRNPEEEPDYGSSYNRYRPDSDWENNANRDYDSERDRTDRRGYRQTGSSRDYEPDYGRYSRRDYNRDSNRRGYPGGVYPAAGMGSDYDARPGDRYREDYDKDVNYGEGDVGYESSGAFYQDMDEPINYRTQDYGNVSGHEPVTGAFYGMGPHGYQRSDERIMEDVCERLTRHGRVDASDIAIQVDNGEVTLQGTVPDRSMKRIAEDVVENVGGVRDVHNEIRVNRQHSWDTTQTGDQSSWEYRWPQEAEAEAEQADESPAGQTTAGAGLTTEGAIDLEGAERSVQSGENRKGVREEMEVIGSDGRVVGRVKEIRQSDFLVDREMARDVYVPFSAVNNVGEQILLNVNADQVDNQGWEKPSVI